MPATAPVKIITDHHFAERQGHNLLAKHLAAASCEIAGWSGSLSQRLFTKFLRRFPTYRGLSPTHLYHVYLTNRLSRQASSRVGLIHCIWGEDVIDRSEHPERCIFTLHQPYELWSETTWRKIAASAGIVCMAGRECEEIHRRCPGVPCVFIPHGIDIDFWRPVATPPQRQICAVGRYLRNFEMLLRVARVLLERHPDLTFRWLVNPDFKVPPAVASALPPERFELARNLSPAELHRFYTTSWAFLTPYNNVAASNAIVESMASGTPVFTTRVGGMPSYAGQDAITMVENNDDEAMIAAVTRCLDSATVRAELGARARRHAEEHFAWPHVVAGHERFYADLLKK